MKNYAFLLRRVGRLVGRVGRLVVEDHLNLEVTRTDGRRAVSCDLDTADGALRVVKIEEDYAHAVYATLGEGNVPVFCSREAWKAWWEANTGGKVVKSEQSGGFVTEITTLEEAVAFLESTKGPSSE